MSGFNIFGEEQVKIIYNKIFSSTGTKHINTNYPVSSYPNVLLLVKAIHDICEIHSLNEEESSNTQKKIFENLFQNNSKNIIDVQQDPLLIHNNMQKILEQLFKDFIIAQPKLKEDIKHIQRIFEEFVNIIKAVEVLDKNTITQSHHMYLKKIIQQVIDQESNDQMKTENSNQTFTDKIKDTINIFFKKLHIIPEKDDSCLSIAFLKNSSKALIKPLDEQYLRAAIARDILEKINLGSTTIEKLNQESEITIQSYNAKVIPEFIERQLVLILAFEYSTDNLNNKKRFIEKIKIKLSEDPFRADFIRKNPIYDLVSLRKIKELQKNVEKLRNSVSSHE